MLAAQVSSIKKLGVGDIKSIVGVRVVTCLAGTWTALVPEAIRWELSVLVPST